MIVNSFPRNRNCSPTHLYIITLWIVWVCTTHFFIVLASVIWSRRSDIETRIYTKIICSTICTWYSISASFIYKRNSPARSSRRFCNKCSASCRCRLNCFINKRGRATCHIIQCLSSNRGDMQGGERCRNLYPQSIQSTIENKGAFCIERSPCVILHIPTTPRRWWIDSPRPVSRKVIRYSIYCQCSTCRHFQSQSRTESRYSTSIGKI